MSWFRVGALAMALGVVIGAFGAHGLKDKLSSASMEIFQTAVFYHLVHALALVVLGVHEGPQRPQSGSSGGLLLAGIFLFSGSLYLYSLLGWTWLGAVTPFGGMCFILGWGRIAFKGR